MPAFGRKADRSIYLGVDPGVNGGIAVILSRREVDLFHLADKSPEDVWNFVSKYGTAMGCELHGDLEVRIFACIERNHGYIGTHSGPNTHSFKFGEATGAVRMALVAAEIPREEPTASQWLRALGMRSREKGTKGKKGETDTQWKNYLKAKAQALFPGVQVTLRTADALLIAEYCRRKMAGELCLTSRD